MIHTPVNAATLLRETEQFVGAFFAEKISKDYVFHDWEHTLQTVAAVRLIGEGFDFDEREILLLQLGEEILLVGAPSLVASFLEEVKKLMTLWLMELQLVVKIPMGQHILLSAQVV